MVCIYFSTITHKLYTTVHVLGTASWRKITQVPSYPITCEAVFAHGCLHWLACGTTTKVIWFDVKKEEFFSIDNPNKKTGDHLIKELVDLNGEVGFVYYHKFRSVELRVLKQKEWVIHCRFDHKPPLSDTYAMLLMNKNGDILISLTDGGGQRLFAYKLQNDVLDEAKIVGRGETHYRRICMYPISLLSNRGINTNSYSIKT